MNFYFSTMIQNFEKFEGCHLIQDHIGTRYSVPWNDYSYYVTFQVYLCIDGVVEKIGSTKILATDHMSTDKLFLTGAVVATGKMYDITELLNIENVVSLSSDLDFYRKINRLLNGADRVSAFLSGICDASYAYTHQSEFRKRPGFAEALLRSGSMSEAALKKGHQIAAGNYEPESEFTIVVQNLPDTFEPVDFFFDNSGDLGRSNVNILIGRNGVGKTHVLCSLIESITGIAKTEEKWPYFHKLIVAAYSPFEKFYTKSAIVSRLHEVNNVAIKKDSSKKRERRRLNVNEYAYIGFKNEDGIFSLDWPREHSATSLVKILAEDIENGGWKGSYRFATLFDVLATGINFDNMALRRHGEAPLLLNKENFTTIKSFDDIDFKKGLSFFRQGEEISLSSGQVIYSYLLPSLMAEIEDESLLIIDEPELYLHPALEVSLIEMLKILLRVTSSYAIIATHSTVMAREVGRSGVRILRAENGKTVVATAGFETFRESLDLIAGEAFDDYHVKKPYQHAIDTVIEREGVTNALELVRNSVGDDALSYIFSRLKAENDKEVMFEDLQ